MPTSVGPNTFGEENLVFGYDTGDTANSYRGEPTVNLVTNPDFSTGDYSGWSSTGAGGAVEITEVSSENRYYFFHKKVNKVADGGLDRLTQSSTYTINTSLQTTVSIDIWINPSNAYSLTFYGLGSTADDTTFNEKPLTNNGTVSSTIDLGGGWTRYIYTLQTGWYTGSGNTFRIAVYPNYSGRGFLEYKVKQVQVEQKSHATPFVNGTRSATQGLIDLTGNSTIDLTNASFDSNAQMTFDGTSDYASVGYSTAINTPNGATYEIMLYPESGGEFLSRGKSDSGTDPDNPRFYIDGTGYLYFDWSTTGADTYVVTPGSTATFNQWQHVVGVAQPGDQLRIYVNGVEASYNSVVRTVPSPVPNTEDPLIIGGVSWIPRYFDGKIGMVKLYNRALTASEIRSNFNAIKSRFNI